MSFTETLGFFFKTHNFIGTHFLINYMVFKFNKIKFDFVKNVFFSSEKLHEYHVQQISLKQSILLLLKIKIGTFPHSIQRKKSV